MIVTRGGGGKKSRKCCGCHIWKHPYVVCRRPPQYGPLAHSWLIVDKEMLSHCLEETTTAQSFSCSPRSVAPLLLLFHVAEKSIRRKRRIGDRIKERESPPSSGKIEFRSVYCVSPVLCYKLASPQRVQYFTMSSGLARSRMCILFACTLSSSIHATFELCPEC